MTDLINKAIKRSIKRNDTALRMLGGEKMVSLNEIIEMIGGMKLDCGREAEAYKQLPQKFSDMGYNNALDDLKNKLRKLLENEK